MWYQLLLSVTSLSVAPVARRRLADPRTLYALKPTSTPTRPHTVRPYPSGTMITLSGTPGTPHAAMSTEAPPIFRLASTAPCFLSVSLLWCTPRRLAVAGETYAQL